MPWGVAAAAVAAAGSIASSSMQKSAANKASKAQGGAAASAAQAEQEALQQSREDLAPYRGSGYAANNQLSYLLGLNSNGSGGFSGNSGAEGVLGAINPNLSSAIEARKIRSPSLSGSDWADSTYLQLVNELASASPSEYAAKLANYGMPPGISQSEWQSANTKLQAGDFSAAKAPGSEANNGYGDSINKDLGNYGSLSKRFSLADYQADPGYQFRLDQGNKAINAAQSARGNFYSGKALKEADAYNSNQASQEYANAYNRYTTDQNNLYSRLAGVSNQGMGATNNAVSLNQDNASAMGNIYGQLGNVNAANSVANGNANAQGIGSIASLIGQGISSYGKSPSYSSSYVGPGGSNVWGNSYGSTWNNPDSIWS